MKLRTFASISLIIASLAGASLARAEAERPYDEAPTPLRTVAPVYPGELRRDGIDGLVAVSALIDENGNVAETKVAKSSNIGFEKPALDAVTQWKFKPAKKGGQAVPVRIVLPVKFVANS